MKVLSALLVFLGLSIALATLSAVPVMLLWDWLMPSLFGLREVTLFEAWGLLMLCDLLFKSTGSAK